MIDSDFQVQWGWHCDLTFLPSLNPVQDQTSQPDRPLCNPRIEEASHLAIPAPQHLHLILLHLQIPFPTTSPTSYPPCTWWRLLLHPWLLELDVLSAMSRLPKHLAGRRFGVPVQVICCLWQHDLIQLVQGNVGMHIVLLFAIDGHYRRILFFRKPVLRRTMGGGGFKDR